MKNRVIYFVATAIIWLSTINCTCPPLNDSDEGIATEFEMAEEILVGDIILLDSKQYCYEFKVKKVLKGDFKRGQVITGYYNPSCGPIVNSLGKWVLAGSIHEHFELDPCGLSFNIENPNIYAFGVQDPASSQEYIPLDDTEAIKEKNKTLAARILRYLKTFNS